MKPIKIVLVIVVILLFLYSTVTASDTIRYITGKCGQLKRGLSVHQEDIEFGLFNDTLHIWGSINANCCGEHFLVVTQNENNYNFETLDTGKLCRCMCIYPFDVKIPKSNLPEYRIKISTLDTTVKSAVYTDVRENEKTIRKNSIEVFFEGSSVIRVYLNSNYKKVTASLYDLLGKEVQSFSSINSPELILNLNNNLKGVYLLKVKSENSIQVKKIILK